MTVLNKIREKQAVDKTYSIGGLPHTFIELFGGEIVPMLWHEPEPFSFRSDYYYNTQDNCLYVKLAKWVDVGQEFDREDSGFVYKAGRAIKKMVHKPDPKQFGDLYYYSIADNNIYGRVVRWTKSNNL